MSDMHTEESHASPIKTPKQLIVAVIASLLIPIIVILLLVNYVTQGNKTNAGSDANKPATIEARIAPVAKLELVDANAPKVLKTGEQVYKAVCFACHAAGAAGAPKFADASAWAPRLKQGYETLVQHSINGIRAMPAKGGNPDLDDIEVARAVAYMANQAGANFKEPSAPAPTAAPASNAAHTESLPVNKAEPSAAAQPAQPMAAAVVVAAAATPAVKADAGKKLYESACIACHGAGIAGAPKFADKTAWAPRIKNGVDALVQSVIKGKNAMPPKGGVANANEADIREAVIYMVNAAK